jgi:very-short-patch-repair endonuclease
VRWEASRLVVEIDGAQHREGLNATADNLSRNAVTLGNDRVLRIDLIGLRLYEDEYLQQVRLGLSP